jgi:pSer/pThr/pTyr-binding forkhead associated (FHA) protein
MGDSTVPTIRLLRGHSKKTLVEIAGRITLGRLGSTDVPLSDGKASREHARIFEQAGEWHIVDLNSTNGTLVNDAKITRRALRDGDEITIGETTFLFEVPAPSAPEPPAAPPPPPVTARPAKAPEPDIPTMTPIGAAPAEQIVIKQRNLKFSSYESGRKVNPMMQDVSQRGGLFKLIIFAAVIVLGICFFIGAIHLGQSFTSPDDEPTYEDDTRYDDATE